MHVRIRDLQPSWAPSDMDVRAHTPTQRYAGQWEPPPALYRAIAKWAAEVYAGHILSLVEARMETWAARGRARRSLVTLALYQGQGPNDIRTLKLKKRVRFESPVGGTDLVVEHLDIDHWRVGEGKGTRIDWDRRMLLDEALQVFAGWIAHQTAQAEVLNRRQQDLKVSASTIVEFHHLRQECLKHTREAKRRRNRVEGSTALDLTGWKYLQKGLTEEERTRVESFGPINLRLVFRGTSVKFDGLWEYFGRRVTIVAPAGDVKSIPTVKLFRERLHNMLGTVWHETQHVGQYVFRSIRGMKDYGGLPSARLRDPEVQASGRRQSSKVVSPKLSGRKRRLPHEQRDIEFYPNLGSDTLSLRKLLLGTTPLRRFDTFKAFVGERRTGDTSSRLKTLKAVAPAKWQALVRLLYKAVADLL